MELTVDQRRKSNFRFGGKVLIVLERDKYTCVDCGMTNEEHLNKYGKRLTINHINGKGRNSKIPDNRLNNLETLCLVCHGKKDCKNEKWQEYKRTHWRVGVQCVLKL